MLIPNGGEEFVGLMIVKLRFRSRSGEGQVKLRKLRKVRYLDLSYTLFLVFQYRLWLPQYRLWLPHKLLESGSQLP